MGDEARTCKCGKTLESAEVSVLSDVKPREAFSCSTCRATLLIFTIAEQPDLAVWLDEWDMAEPFTEFLLGKIAEQRYN